MHRLLRRHAVPRLPGALRRRGRHARRRLASRAAARRLAGLGQAARRPRPGLRAGRRGRRARRPGRQEPLRHRAGRAWPRTSARSPGDCVFFAAGTADVGARRCSARPGSRSAGASELIDDAAWSFLWVVDAPLFEPAGDAVAAGDVAVGSGAWTAVHHAFTSPKPESMDTFDTDPGAGAGLRLRHRLQRQRDRRRLDPYPPPRRAGAGLRGHGAERGRRPARSSASCSTPSASARRRTAASPSAGTASARCCRGTDSIRDVIAFPKTGGGFDPLTGAPAPITAEQRKEAGVDAVAEDPE